MFFRAVLLLVVACVQRSCQHQSGPLKDEVLTEDRRFCRGELEISYPDLDIRSCMIIPQEFREKISQEWGPPQVRLAMADKQKKYTLIMVDPDAPSRTNPSRAYWRHWLLADIETLSISALLLWCRSSKTPLFPLLEERGEDTAVPPKRGMEAGSMAGD
ncbi:phosphatidylethanolamine-binding protein 4 isoform X4 [Tachysurus fulvidraco]|uniref:phosphatidylethanolamine-binding protein 4 isoform X4 n=1 Tax=Tachysurus fulvidraco TaxID=1234273 RepID=UPI001FF05E7A|nr:phosphatidylethanolamine-binding protein 4 isoform X4 [Tachysurus fulvidraco]